MTEIRTKIRTKRKAASLLLICAASYTHIKNTQRALLAREFRRLLIAQSAAQSDSSLELLPGAESDPVLIFRLRNPAVAASTTLALMAAIEAEDWKGASISAEVTARAVLHYGPVIERSGHQKETVSQPGLPSQFLLEIEGSLTPGCVYATQVFAAKLALSVGLDHFRFGYWCPVPLPGGHGTSALYRLDSAI